jgi:hypothetical protein
MMMPSTLLGDDVLGEILQFSIPGARRTEDQEIRLALACSSPGPETFGRACLHMYLTNRLISKSWSDVWLASITARLQACFVAPLIVWAALRDHPHPVIVLFAVWAHIRREGRKESEEAGGENKTTKLTLPIHYPMQYRMLSIDMTTLDRFCVKFALTPQSMETTPFLVREKAIRRSFVHGNLTAMYKGAVRSESVVDSFRHPLRRSGAMSRSYANDIDEILAFLEPTREADTASKTRMDMLIRYLRPILDDMLGREVHVTIKLHDDVFCDADCVVREPVHRLRTDFGHAISIHLDPSTQHELIGIARASLHLPPSQSRQFTKMMGVFTVQLQFIIAMLFHVLAFGCLTLPSQETILSYIELILRGPVGLPLALRNIPFTFAVEMREAEAQARMDHARHDIRTALKIRTASLRGQQGASATPLHPPPPRPHPHRRRSIISPTPPRPAARPILMNMTTTATPTVLQGQGGGGGMMMPSPSSSSPAAV